ncbi:RNA-binding ribosome biosynthesis protein MAK21 KNAG_0J02350 [Huiozyma naganishii CBS 8797]|uniref:CCAAT-binding factor domain-containing protein n=1 Tax=Huiozyma naganishii (strain ATCC MYA-139 / BCRC 22969 / CBS 8797 / KCTC 17520 / NBRC 10181 / NCYC 3082 / Yp74L-3) TaxID=1071383 RepID=J7RBP8_HUIN7|nr:hypothetical protein KNAG_0J02350 [Kazachstania naganishii CBS 8797]CCK72315.1 hypothetical protein KNAG_0J02350 [Kazachstania naganishii CBS 8797]
MGEKVAKDPSQGLSIRDKVSSKLQNGKKNRSKKQDKKNKKASEQSKDVQERAVKTPEEEDVLKREALALGASENDLELLEDLPEDDASEQEFDVPEEKVDEKFSTDLQKFMQNIGFDKHALEDLKDEDVADEEEIPKLVEQQENNEEEEVEEQAEEEEEPLQEDGELSSSSKEESDIESEQETEKKAKKDDGLITSTNFLSSDKLVIPNDLVWYEVELDSQLKRNVQDSIDPLTPEQCTKLYERGKLALEEDNQTYYDEFTKDSSQKKFMSQILTGGTLMDKISALTLLIQDSPIHNIKSLDTLLSFSNKKSRNSQLQSLNALKDLFLHGLLPDRKLRYFKNQPGLSMMVNKKTLAIFYFEDYLKKFFFKVLEILEKLSHDPIIHVRMQTLTHIFDLLSNKPEQEFNLLKLGVNKVGDIDSKVSSKASYLLLKLEQAHPNMKSVIIDTIVDTALRVNADYHTTYYSVITLNQTILRKSDDSVANKLVKTYFTLFEKFLVSTDEDNKHDVDIKSDAKKYEEKRKKNVKKGKNGGKSVKEEKTEEEKANEKNSKLFSALLTGINRAFPFAEIPASVYEVQMETLFKITHSSNFNTSVQALILINQVTTKAELNNDRYYRTLYESLLDPRLVNSSKQGVYMNLLYKSLKQDSKNVERVEAFVKRILQVSCHWINVGTIAGFLFLLLQLQESLPQIKNLLTNTPVDHEYLSDDESQDARGKKLKKYDGRKRDPRFANADSSSLWEIHHFLQHFHPTVQAYASAFIDGELGDITKPDLGLFTLSHFLDRFVYRNAKQKPVTRGSSIMQPLLGGSQINASVMVKASDAVSNEVPVNTQNWLKKKVNEIKPEDKFFYQYFSSKKSAVKDKQRNASSGNDSEGEMNEDDIWNALVKSRPDVEDDSGDEMNFDEDDFSLSSDNEEESEGEASIGGAQSDSDSDKGDEDEENDIFYSFADEESKNAAGSAEEESSEDEESRKHILEESDDDVDEEKRQKEEQETKTQGTTSVCIG